MALSVYCPKCAVPNEYTLRKPVICGFCGAPLASDSFASKNVTSAVLDAPAPSIAPIQTPAPKVMSPRVDIPNIQGLDFEIESFESNGITFKDLAHQKKTGFSRPKAKKVNLKKEVELFRTEASSMAITPVAREES